MAKKKSKSKAKQIPTSDTSDVDSDQGLVIPSSKDSPSRGSQLSKSPAIKVPLNQSPNHRNIADDARGRTRSFLSDGAKRLTHEPTVSEPIPTARPTMATEQKISASIQSNSPRRLDSWRYGSSLSRSGPGSIPKGSLTKSRIQSRRQSNVDSDSDREIAEILSEHLVKTPQGNMMGASIGSTSHHLVGGAITRDIYKWQEDVTREEPLNRSNSVPDLPSMERGGEASIIREPGGFRRHFIEHRSRQQGKKAPNFLTRNFIDFLVLYGHYGGDVYPSDEDSEYSEEENDIEEMVIEADENTALLERPAIPRTSSITIPAVHHTSEPKAFFMLLKAFVGTGVLFLPKAFVNGGLVFALVAMVFMGLLTTHCMILLNDTSRYFGHKSFGELGKVIYGEECRLLVLGSIAISQMV